MFIYLIDYNYNNYYYVGKTSASINMRFDSHKCSCKKNKTKHHKVWNKSLNEGNYPEIIILEETNGDKINDLEKWYITYFKSIGVKLTNLTMGGDGLQGHIFSNEHRDRISKTKISQKLTNTIEHNNILKMANSHPRTEEFKQKMKIIRTGVKWSDEVKNKISKSNKGKHNDNNRQKKITQMDLSNNVINTFNSISEAALYLNPDKFKSLCSSIECAANPNGKQSTSFGYIWKYN
jgi:group I intron endonuclease